MNDSNKLKYPNIFIPKNRSQSITVDSVCMKMESTVKTCTFMIPIQVCNFHFKYVYSTLASPVEPIFTFITFLEFIRKIP